MKYQFLLQIKQNKTLADKWGFGDPETIVNNVLGDQVGVDSIIGYDLIEFDRKFNKAEINKAIKKAEKANLTKVVNILKHYKEVYEFLF